MKIKKYNILVILFLSCITGSQVFAAVDCDEYIADSKRGAPMDKYAENEEYKTCCGKINGVYEYGTGVCCTGPGCFTMDNPTESSNFDSDLVCCYDLPDYYGKNEECCEMNDKYEYQHIGGEEETGECCVKDQPTNVLGKVTEACCGSLDNSRIGVWSGKAGSEDGDCCIPSSPNDYKGHITEGCCHLYGMGTSSSVTDSDHSDLDGGYLGGSSPVSLCEFRNSNCCRRDSRYLCDNTKSGYYGVASFTCCNAAGGQVVVEVNGGFVPYAKSGLHVSETNNTQWRCCKTFGYRLKGAKQCTSKDGITGDFG